MAKENYFTQLPGWAKGVLAVGALGIIAFVGYKIYKKAKENIDKKEEKKVLADAEQELAKLQKTEKPSFPSSIYSSVANVIQQHLDGCERITTEIKVAEEIIKIVKKRIDWLLLVKAFGVRKIDNCGYLSGDTMYDLPTLLKEQLDGTLLGDSVGGERWWNKTVYQALSTKLEKAGVTI